MTRPNNLTADGRRRGARNSARNRRELAIAEQADVAAIALGMERQGLSLNQIARRLDARRIPTRQGSVYNPDLAPAGGWSANQVKRMLDRIRRPG